MSKIPKSFYLRSDVIELSKELLEKFLFTSFDNTITGGKIIETEAYAGVNDSASHAFRGRKTRRTEVMYHEGGVGYVYWCYGIHALFNVITNKKDIPHAILIRAIVPTHGIKTMYKRRGNTIRDLTGGPGTLSKALGITVKHNGINLTGDKIWIEDKGVNVREKDIIISKRVGVENSGKDALLPYRFRIKE